MTPQYIARRLGRSLDAQVFDRIRSKWVSGTDDKNFTEVTDFARRMNERAASCTPTTS